MWLKSDGPNDSSTESNQQQDWSIVSECFEHPQTLLHTAGGGLSRAMQVIIILLFVYLTFLSIVYLKDIWEIDLKNFRIWLEMLSVKWEGIIVERLQMS